MLELKAWLQMDRPVDPTPPQPPNHHPSLQLNWVQRACDYVSCFLQMDSGEMAGTGWVHKGPFLIKECGQLSAQQVGEDSESACSRCGAGLGRGLTSSSRCGEKRSAGPGLALRSWTKEERSFLTS